MPAPFSAMALRRNSVRRLADQVLQATVAADGEATVALYTAWREVWGQPSMQDLVWMACRWADTAIDVLGGPAEAGELIELKFRDETGEIKDAGEVRPSVAWAGRFIAARAAVDEPQQQALFEVLYDMPPSMMLDYVEEILASAAIAIAGMRR